MKRLVSIAVLLGVAAAACDSRPLPDPVVVYMEAAQESELAETFSRFTDETRIPVNVRVGDSASNTDDLIRKRAEPPADILLTSSVADIWRAAEKGALRPVQGRAFDGVPPSLKDPDRLWSALMVRSVMIGTSPDADQSLVTSYGDLAKSELRGKVCLSSAALSVNRSLIGMLIEDRGLKPAEHTVRAWVRNLAAPPFASEAELVDALRSGRCDYGIVSGSIGSGGLALLTPRPLYVDIDGIGISRHATQPESAQKLVDWLLGTTVPNEPDQFNGKNIGLAGWRAEDVALLVERAGYR